MGFLDNLRKALGGGQGAKGSGGGSSSFGGDGPNTYWIYAQCRRCGEPLKARVNLEYDLKLTEDEASWLVRKGLMGTGVKRCLQTVEVTLKFDKARQQVLESEVTWGKLITEEEYEELLRKTQNENV